MKTLSFLTVIFFTVMMTTAAFLAIQFFGIAHDAGPYEGFGSPLGMIIAIGACLMVGHYMDIGFRGGLFGFLMVALIAIYLLLQRLYGFDVIEPYLRTGTGWALVLTVACSLWVLSQWWNEYKVHLYEQMNQGSDPAPPTPESYKPGSTTDKVV